MAIKLPYQQTQDRQLNQFQLSLASALQPITSNPAAAPVFLKNVQLSTGTNRITHLLDRTLQGWVVVRQRASATLYDIQDTNPNQNQTLLLVASAPVSVDLMVF